MRTLREQLQIYSKTLVYYKYIQDKLGHNKWTYRAFINKTKDIKNTVEVLELENIIPKWKFD